MKQWRNTNLWKMNSIKHCLNGFQLISFAPPIVLSIWEWAIALSRFIIISWWPLANEENKERKLSISYTEWNWLKFFYSSNLLVAAPYFCNSYTYEYICSIEVYPLTLCPFISIFLLQKMLPKCCYFFGSFSITLPFCYLFFFGLIYKH